MHEPQNSPVPHDNDAAPTAVPATEAAAPAVLEPAAPPIADLPPAAVAAKLAELFPPLFGAGRALPIKLRIQADIQQRAPGLFNKKSLSIFLHRHTTSTAYLKALAQAPARLDLDGQPAGDIAQEHRDAAAVELNRRLAIVQERRAAERKAQRQAERPAVAPPQDGTAPAAAPSDRPPRPPRPPRPDGAPRGDRPPRQDRPARTDRPDRPDRAARPERMDRPPRQDRPDRPPRPDHSQPPAAPEALAPREPLTPEQAAAFEARRSRALVLRAFETTTLTRANFCALKGMNDAALEAILVQARAERGERPALKPPRSGPISR